MQTESRQPLLSSLLGYYGEGNFITFKKICDIAYPNTGYIYFYSNFFTALNIAGFIEINNNYTSLMRWYSAVNRTKDFIFIKSLKSKIIGTSNDWYRDSKIKPSPLIMDQNNKCLVEGMHKTDFSLNKTNIIFNEKFFERLPKLPIIERVVSFEERMPPVSNGRVEMFNYVLKKWVHVNSQAINEPSLIRITKEFTGVYYYVTYPEINLYYRIQNPEWEFIISAVHLGWDTASYFKYENNNLTIDMQFKIPILILRILFSASECLKIGARLEFINIDKKCAKSFFNYMNNILGIMSWHY